MHKISLVHRSGISARQASSNHPTTKTVQLTSAVAGRTKGGQEGGISNVAAGFPEPVATQVLRAPRHGKAREPGMQDHFFVMKMDTGN